MSKICNAFVIEIKRDECDFNLFHMCWPALAEFKVGCVSLPTFNAFMDVVFIYTRFSRAALGCKYSVLLFP